jgi:hypothetical protein
MLANRYASVSNLPGGPFCLTVVCDCTVKSVLVCPYTCAVVDGSNTKFWTSHASGACWVIEIWRTINEPLLKGVMKVTFGNCPYRIVARSRQGRRWVLPAHILISFRIQRPGGLLLTSRSAYDSKLLVGSLGWGLEPGVTADDEIRARRQKNVHG